MRGSYAYIFNTEIIHRKAAENAERILIFCLPLRGRQTENIRSFASFDGIKQAII